jgi:hypothetical protein
MSLTSKYGPVLARDVMAWPTKQCDASFDKRESVQGLGFQDSLLQYKSKIETQGQEYHDRIFKIYVFTVDPRRDKEGRRCPSLSVTKLMKYSYPVSHELTCTVLVRANGLKARYSTRSWASSTVATTTAAFSLHSSCATVLRNEGDDNHYDGIESWLKYSVS